MGASLFSGDVCQLPVDKGRCQNVMNRYFYDSGTNACKRFEYSGCGGNDNNFKTVEKCRIACEGEETDGELSSCVVLGCCSLNSKVTIDITGR